MDVADLIRKAKKGDGTAFWELIKDKRKDLYRIAYCYVKNEEDALDVVSETIYKALSSLPKLKRPEYFQTWLTRILINAAITHLRKVKPLTAAQGEIPNPPMAANTDREEVLDLYQAIDHLEGKHKTIIILKYLEDMTITDIADVLKMPVGTVKTYLNRALKKLRLDLEEVG